MGTSVVVIKQGGDKFELLLDTLREAGFFESLEEKLAWSGLAREEFRVAVKPNFMVLTGKEDLSNYTDTSLVVALLAELRDRGFQRLHVVESQNVLGEWYGNRTVASVARQAGYAGDFYEIDDLTLDAVPHPFTGILEGHRAGRAWKEADYRISFAKNKTHPAGVYTLTLKNIFGCLVLPNKYLDYHKKLEWDLVTIAMLEEFPVDFGIVDAIWSADGPFGFRGNRRPRRTDTLLAGRDLMALDWAGALKMGIDPMRSRIMRKLVARKGEPEYAVSGPTAPYPGWRQPPRLLPRIDDLLEEWNGAHSFLTHCIMLPVDAEFPEPHAWFYRSLRRVLGFTYA